ncbi:bifunctional UDP-N-acetylglucosamine diphosphorylase/glucosamine-1-phosphate N-acetyltransferase GlmU [Luminiphilus sp.]|jgi:bifunctional UDP-N-acetylglucosamine pyrophosphorylase/glucosamine-1-phosphate N-acetyltransferase|nr:bifunctional UDP-N-acetylglucosamine diphosphorylase/glucosamine-1-phosphate N-acetyltransferase GlmU [Luminiphilus sp.]MDC0410996.1 bifunctional UDP-N-acetylglucosamine diphosphorylase/glucosamine-1-phosphate N-acetyltransferase GlmU [Luminiphilus sp.]
MLEVIILAAGQGSRMQSRLPKVLHLLSGRPLIHYTLDAARAAGANRIHVVIGCGADAVEAAVRAPDVQCHLQAEQKGTGHAVQQAIGACHSDSTLLILFGDVPLVTVPTLQAVVAVAKDGIAMLSAEVAEPSGYGRVIRDEQGDFLAVVEHRDASLAQQQLREINTGVLASRASLLAGWLARIQNDNAQSEYYLPDVLALAKGDGVNVAVVVSDSALDTLGVNTPQQLEHLERQHQQVLVERLMAAGVAVVDRARLDIRGSLRCGSDVSIDLNVLFEGTVTLGDEVTIGAHCVIRNADIESGAKILPFTYIDGAIVKAGAEVGPYARLRPGTEIGEQAKVGNFVEIKNASLGTGAKASHLTYLGDATVGAWSNIGAGTITCNYDGANKYRTELGEAVFIGSNSTLVAPLSVASGGFVAAGSTITDDVESDQLAVARGRQHNVDGWQRPRKTEDKQ